MENGKWKMVNGKFNLPNYRFTIYLFPFPIFPYNKVSLKGGFYIEVREPVSRAFLYSMGSTSSTGSIKAYVPPM